MPNKAGHRRFGSIRKLSSGRYQIRYQGPDGQFRTGTQTYESKAVADRALSLVEAQIMTGQWTDPVAGKTRLSVYARRWIDQRPGLRPRTVELYEWLPKRHITPYLGNSTLAGITPDGVRDWRARLLSDGVSESATAKAYRLLRAVLAIATDDRAIARNPCRIRGAGDENPAERPVLTIRQVYQLADRVTPRYRALVLVLTFASLRWGEAIALRRHDLDVLTGTVTVHQQYIELSSGHKLGPPKSRAGARTVAMPSPVVRALTEHLQTYVPADEHALIFTGPLGGILRRGNFRRSGLHIWP
jgi:integrase